jgi:eukaryotic-like serine/threonine-protein kinase
MEKLGEGGMGAVYRARDTKLNREVALKVLLPAVANDPERLARFSREAQVLASLNHPHIAGIHGLEDAGETKALVMELSRARTSRNGSPAAPSRWARRCRSRGRSPRRWKRRTRRASCIGI